MRARISTPTVIAGGTPLDDAVAFGQWETARRLIERGAYARLFNAAALGLLDRIQVHLTSDPAPGRHHGRLLGGLPRPCRYWPSRRASWSGTR